MNDREKLRARVRALLAKTVENGCTEDEAMTAVAKAAALMRDYALSGDELEITGADVERGSRRRTGRERLWATIAHVTNCAALNSWRDEEPIIRFYGTEPGPQVAVYLKDVCSRAIDTEIAAFKRTEIYGRRRKAATRRQAVQDFTQGMVIRLSNRLYRLFEPSMNEAQQALAVRARDNANPDARTMKPLGERKARFADANFAGWEAGGNVGLHHGVDGQGEVRRIGDGS